MALGRQRTRLALDVAFPEKAREVQPAHEGSFLKVVIEFGLCNWFDGISGFRQAWTLWGLPFRLKPIYSSS